MFYRGVDHDENYLDRVEELKKALEAPDVEFEGVHPKNAEVQVHVMEGDDLPSWLFIAHADLIKVGYQNLEDFDVVRVNGDYYELQGYLEGTGVWWVEEIPLDGAEEASEA